MEENTVNITTMNTENTENTILCSRCKILKNVSEYAKDKKRRNNYQIFCKQCQKEYHMEYYKKYEEKLIKNGKCFITCEYCGTKNIRKIQKSNHMRTCVEYKKKKIEKLNDDNNTDTKAQQ